MGYMVLVEQNEFNLLLLFSRNCYDLVLEIRLSPLWVSVPFLSLKLRLLLAGHVGNFLSGQEVVGVRGAIRSHAGRRAPVRAIN